MQQEEQSSQFTRFKQRLFAFTSQLISNEVGLSIYIGFLLIESLQFIGYHHNGLITYHMLGWDQLATVTQLVNPLVPIQNHPINSILVGLFALLCLTHFLLGVVGYRAYHKRVGQAAREVAQANFHKHRIEYFINLLMVGFNTCLTIPVFVSSITAVYCIPESVFSKNQECYSGYGLLIVLLAIVNLVWLAITNVYFSLYYYSRNPFSHNCLTCSSNWWSLGKFVLKVAPMCFFLYDPKAEFPVLFLVICVGIYGGYIFLFRLLIPFHRYNFDLQKKVFSIQLFTFLFVVAFVISHFQQDVKDEPNLILICWAVFSLLITLVVLDLFVQMKKEMLQDIHSLEKNKLESVLQYLLYLIYWIEKAFRSGDGRFFIANIAVTHRSHCKSTSCYCHEFFSQSRTGDYSGNKRILYTILLAIIDRVLAEHKKAYPFFSLKAYILYYKMESQIKAATTISIIMGDKLDFSNDMLVRGLLFELDMMYVDTRDMEVYRKFNQFLLRQEEESNHLVTLYINYWSELIDQQSSVSKLKGLIRSILRSKKELEHIVEGGLKIFRNHTRVLFLYKNFLKEVLNDYVNYIRQEEKYKIGLKESKLTNIDAANTIQFRPNESLLVVNFTRHYSTHSDLLGNYKITSISSNVKEFLGYNNRQLKDQGLNKLIPRIYHGVHDRFIDRVLDKSDREITSRQIRIFPVNSRGHLIECNVISKFMPSVTHGINIVSFIEECDRYKDEFFIIYDANSGMVDSMNQEAEMVLKDGGRRKMNDILAIPDHINDLVPNWDYKNEKWRTVQRSNREIETSPDLVHGMREIEVMRSDGIDDNSIKVMKFKGDYFVRMFSNDAESLKESNTIKQYLEFRNKESSLQDVDYRQMDSNKLEEVIISSNKDLMAPVRTTRHQKKVATIKKKKNKVKELEIDRLPDESSRITFSVMQWASFLGGILALILIFVLNDDTGPLFKRDVALQVDLSDAESDLAVSTYQLNRVVAAETYANPGNLTLPYNRYAASMNSSTIKNLTQSAVASVNTIMDEINPVLVSKVERQHLENSEIDINVTYLTGSGSTTQYSKKMDITHAIYQSNDYTLSVAHKIGTLTPEQIIRLPDYFFVVENSWQLLPSRLRQLAVSIRNFDNYELDQATHRFVVVHICLIGLMGLSVVTMIIFYRYTYQISVWRVLQFYQKIKIDHIKVYFDKCQKYKQTLNQYSKEGDMMENASQEREFLEPTNTDRSMAKAMEQQDRIMQTEGDKSMVNNDEESKLLGDQAQVAEGDHYLIIEEQSSMLNLGLKLCFGFLIFGSLVGLVSYLAYGSTASLGLSLQTLSSYTTMQSSMMRLRMMSYMSLNPLGYHNSSWVSSTLRDEFSAQFNSAITLINDTSLDFSAVRPQISAKIAEFKTVQDLVEAQDTTGIQGQIDDIESQLADMDQIYSYLKNQSKASSEEANKTFDSNSSLFGLLLAVTFILVLAFWGGCIRHYYRQLKEEHEIAYEMYHILSYNLRKKIERVD